MGKDKFFSKLNINNYNNELEDILDKKSFSEGTKNILLNILYKMETAYDDYKKVKQEVDAQKDILEGIIELINKKCKEIELIKPKINEKTKLGDKKFAIEKNKIISYPNEKNLYYGLCHMQNEKFKISKEYSVFQKPMENLFNCGYIIDLEELIRDFDGWAWNVVTEDIENLTSNLIYQNIKILLGHQFLKECILNMNNINFLDNLEKTLDSLYNEEISNNLKEKFYIISVLDYLEHNIEEKEKIEREKKVLQKNYDKINDKKGYLQEIANKKKEIGKEIKDLDELLNNSQELNRKFKVENKNLDKKMNLNEYIDKLHEKRKKLLKNLKLYGNLMKPMNYVKNKYRIKRICEFLDNIDLTGNYKEQKEKNVIDFQINFLKALQEKIGKIELKKNIINYVYILRYYKLLYFNSDTQIKDIEKIKEQLEMTEKYLINRCCNLKLINIFSNNIEKNYEIISKIIDSNIIDLDELNIEFKKKDGKIILNIFDDNMIDKSLEFSEKDDINVKLGKKIKLFI